MTNPSLPKFLRSSRRLLAGAFLLAAALAVRAEDPAWVAKSNANAKVLLDATNKFGPENASATGYTSFDSEVTEFRTDFNSRNRAALAGAREELQKRRLAEVDPLVRQDLEILIQSIDNQIESSLLFERLSLPFFDVGQLVFFGEFFLLQDDGDPARRAAALTRLKRYTGLEPGYTPVTEQAKAYFLEYVKDPNRNHPLKNQVEQGLGNTANYISGIRGLFAKFKIEGAEPALAAMEQQLKDYNEWVRATVLPGARTDFRLPPELYANRLKNVGIDITPEALIEKAQLSYAVIRNQLAALAPLVAKERGLNETDYRAVIRALKREQLAKDQVEPYYHGIIDQIEAIIRREKIVTLPARPMQMRVASDAENAAQPAPHMQPPPLVNNKGEHGTFVLTTGNPSGAGSAAYDDFTFKAATWTLTAHEGRPGHELQYTAMIERGVSLARSIFAFNSVNVEGWALYAEAEMQQHEPLEGQLLALQARLHRSARAFLDPMLNLGLISLERAKEILVNEVCLSPAYAQQEIDRYTFRPPGPGQATAYFYGYTKIMELRASTEIALGSKFDRMAFNDFIVNQGLLPPNLLAKAVREQFVPAQLAKP